MPGLRGEKDEDFSGRIKDFEDKLREQAPQEKKPKDLMRAIGKIETTDWNIKEIEKKIIENKMGKGGNKEKERVPKWSTEQFLARRTKMEKRGVDRQDSDERKFSAIDKSLKQLDQKLKEGTVRELGQNKVSAMTEQFAKQPEPEAKPVQRSNSKVVIPTPGGSENCHFCAKRVYLMERLSAEGRFFHRGCFRCQYCSTMLRLGSYMFDRDGKYGHKFYCSQHFGMQGQLKGEKPSRKSAGKAAKTPDKLPGILDATAIDLIDRVQTPERVEFSNMSPAGVISDHEETFSQMDEDEWTDRNFGASTAELGSSDEDSSDSDSESDDDEVFEEALEEAVTKESTHRLAKEWVKRYSKDREADDDSLSPEDYDTGSDFSYENSSDEEESDTATEGEEEIRARELRKQEVRVKQPIVQTDTGSDTEMASDEESSNESSSDKENSATDIPTDSEFDHDDRTPTGEIPAIMLNDMNITKTRGSGHGHYYGAPKRVQVKSGELQRPINTQKTGNIELKFTPLPTTPITQKVSTPDITNVKPTPLVNPRKGDYLLNRTQSTGGIASKVSLELKKKYLLGSTGLPGNIQKSGSTTTLDSKFKSFHSNISEHQKLLNPAPEISPTMQAFLQGTSKILTPLSPTLTPKSPTFPTDNKFEHVCGLDKDIKHQVTPKKSELKSPEIIDLTLSPSDKFSMQPDITKDVLPEDTLIEICDSPKMVEAETPPDVIYTNDTEGRPRSPLHETSIIVPKIPWNEINKPEKKSESDIDTDSLSSESSEIIEQKSASKVFSDIPRVQIHDSSGELLQEDDIAMDSLSMIPEIQSQETEILCKSQASTHSDTPKSILSEKKTLNQPKVLPGLESSDNTKCHLENKKDIMENKEDSKSESKHSSGRNTPISEEESVCNDATTAALTETELSDWARDGAVSDNLEDVEFDINPGSRINKKSKHVRKKANSRSDARMAMTEDFEDISHICGKDKQAKESPDRILVVQNGAPIADLDSIEYMDTGSEISCEENLVQTTNNGLLKNRGYVHFVNEDEQSIAVDSLTPVVPEPLSNNNETVEAINDTMKVPLSSVDQNTGYCVYGNENERYHGKFGAEVIDLKPNDLEELKQKQSVCDNDDDSLLIIEAGTTTEENTVSDSTVKNLIDKPALENLSERVEEKINRNQTSTKTLPDLELKNGEDNLKTPVAEEHNGIEYNEHINRLQSKFAEFGYVRDSIDIRKSKRRNKSESPPLDSELSELKESSPSIMSPTYSSPATSRKMEEIHKQRSKQHDLIRDLVMDKVKMQKKADKKRRIRDPFSPSSSPVRASFELMKSATVDLCDHSSKLSSLTSGIFTSMDESCKTPENKSFNPLQKSPTTAGVPIKYDDLNEYAYVYGSERSDSLTSAQIYTPVTSLKDLNPKTLARPLSMHGSFIVTSRPLKECSPDIPLTNSEVYSLPDIHRALSKEDFKTPIAPPRTKHEEAKRTAEKMKQEARAKAKMMSDEELGLSPEDKMNIYRQKLNKKPLKKTPNIQDCIQDSIESLVLNTERRNSMFNDTLKKIQNGSSSKANKENTLQNSFSNTDISNKLSLYNDDNIERSRTKSVSEICKVFNSAKSFDEQQLKSSISSNMLSRSDSQKKQQFYKSDPNLLTDAGCKTEKKSKDRERRKSIIKSVTEFFHKKKDTSTTKSPTSSNSASVKDRLSRFRISPKSKEKSKSCFNLDQKFIERSIEAPVTRSKSLSDSSVKDCGQVSPPPIPPPPLNYGANSSTRDDSGSEAEEWKKNHSSETLDQSCAIEGSANSLSRRRVSRSLRKASKQAQIKRHRLAQEIQRKLEETEVKTRELEQRGVTVEKELRGEVTGEESDARDEADLLREWFDLMRDRTELRRYEKELLVRAEELELEDRHARLQQDLRERLAGDDERKTQEDVAAEGAILSEMLEIVAKRDSLIALLEEDRQRYHEEDKDFEAQMLAKGLRLTPIKKTPD